MIDWSSRDRIPAKYLKTQRIHFSKKKNLTLAQNLFDPPGAYSSLATEATIDGWRVGRNPPSVPSSICLIGEPAPQAEFTGVYIPFHSAMGARFILSPPSQQERPECPVLSESDYDTVPPGAMNKGILAGSSHSPTKGYGYWEPFVNQT